MNSLKGPMATTSFVRELLKESIGANPQSRTTNRWEYQNFILSHSFELSVTESDSGRVLRW